MRGESGGLARARVIVLCSRELLVGVVALCSAELLVRRLVARPPTIPANIARQGVRPLDHAPSDF
jgi:hypothetical protein